MIRTASMNSPEFLSTLPVRGATPCILVFVRFNEISIHAPREGSDPAHQPSRGDYQAHFYPRSP